MEVGPGVTEEVVRERLDTLLPKTAKKEKKWSKMIHQAFQKMGFKEEKWPRDHVGGWQCS